MQQQQFQLKVCVCVHACVLFHWLSLLTESVRMSYGVAESTNQAMSSEIQELKKKLRDQRRSLDQVESNAKKYRDLLTRARSTLSTLTADIKDAMTVCDKDMKTKLEVTE